MFKRNGPPGAVTAVLLSGLCAACLQERKQAVGLKFTNINRAVEAVSSSAACRERKAGVVVCSSASAVCRAGKAGVLAWCWC